GEDAVSTDPAYKWYVSDKDAFPNVLATSLTDGQGEFGIRGTNTTDASVLPESLVFAYGINFGHGTWADFGRVAVFLGAVSGGNFGGLQTPFNVTYRVGYI